MLQLLKKTKSILFPLSLIGALLLACGAPSSLKNQTDFLIYSDSEPERTDYYLFNFLTFALRWEGIKELPTYRNIQDELTKAESKCRWLLEGRFVKKESSLVADMFWNGHRQSLRYDLLHFEDVRIILRLKALPPESVGSNHTLMLGKVEVPIRFRPHDNSERLIAWIKSSGSPFRPQIESLHEKIRKNIQLARIQHQLGSCLNVEGE